MPTLTDVPNRPVIQFQNPAHSDCVVETRAHNNVELMRHDLFA